MLGNRDVAPRNVFGTDQLGFEAFGPRAVFGGAHSSAEEYVNLLGVQHVHDGQKRADLSIGERLLFAFSGGRCWSVSPFSMNPAGTVQKPRRGSIARRHNRIRPSCSGTQPTTSFGF